MIAPNTREITLKDMRTIDCYHTGKIIDVNGVNGFVLSLRGSIFIIS